MACDSESNNADSRPNLLASKALFLALLLLLGSSNHCIKPAISYWSETVSVGHLEVM